MSPVATIAPALIKRLREQTSAGVMDCREALEASGGNEALLGYVQIK